MKSLINELTNDRMPGKVLGGGLSIENLNDMRGSL